MNKIKKLARGKKIKIIEDCAQAHGTKFKNKHVGTFGDVGTFSFFPGKNLGAFGDGGAIVTNSKKIFEYCSIVKKYEGKEPPSLEIFLELVGINKEEFYQR